MELIATPITTYGRVAGVHVLSALSTGENVIFRPNVWIHWCFSFQIIFKSVQPNVAQKHGQSRIHGKTIKLSEPFHATYEMHVLHW